MGLPSIDAALALLSRAGVEVSCLPSLSAARYRGGLGVACEAAVEGEAGNDEGDVRSKLTYILLT